MKNKNILKHILSIFGVLVFFALAIGSFRKSNKKLTYANESELFYTSLITDNEAYYLGEYFKSNGWFDKDTHIKTIELDKNGNIYIVRFPVKSNYAINEEYIETCRLMGIEISDEVFNGNSVDIHLCDSFFNTITEIPFSLPSNDEIHSELIGSWQDKDLIYIFYPDSSISFTTLDSSKTIDGFYKIYKNLSIEISTESYTMIIKKVKYYNDTLEFTDESGTIHYCNKIN